MQLVERRIIKSNHSAFAQINEMAFASKNLYNTANYNVRQALFYGGHKAIPSYETLYHLMKATQEYKALPAKVAQQVLRLLSNNWKSFKAALVEYEQEQSKFTGVPKPPKYLEKDGRYCLIFTEQATSKKQLRLGLIKLSEIDYCFETGIILGSVNQYCQSRIVPKLDHYVLEIVYEVADRPESCGERIAAGDLGTNNLVAITANVPGFQPVLINGRPLKSVNQYYNMRRAQIQSASKLPTSLRLKHFTTRRNHIVKDYLHRASTFVINLLADAGINKLVLGKNKGWKNRVNIGSSHNQNFVFIPHAQFIEMLKYKGSQRGIEVIVQEESYTSKASFLDHDPIPTYQQKPDGWKPSGRRVKRGLYVTKNGIALNADVNGSYNILVKAFPNAFGIGDRVVLVTPRKVNLDGHAPVLVSPF